ncbi:MAG: S8 family peptidase [Niabella sp.]
MYKYWIGVIIAGLTVSTGFSQNEGWHLKDKKADGYYGISMDKAYEFVRAKKLKSKPVIVGIVDSGIDTTHEDLKNVLWVNPKEIPGNGIDDDKNGYIEDVHGWNFLGSRDGKENVEKDSYEAARVYWKLKEKFENVDSSKLSKQEAEDYKTWLRAKEDVFKNAKDPSEVEFTMRMAENLKAGDAVIRNALKKDEYSCKDLVNYNPFNPNAWQFKAILMGFCKDNNSQDLTNKTLLEEVDKDLEKMTLGMKPPKAYRDDIVKDNYEDINDRYYGNGNLYVGKDAAMHGTHVAGIVGAERGNGLGMDGVADNVRIMAVRAVPDGDEHDKDVALAIRYAVDNGARVINMSFGKGFSPEKKWVDDAIRYADSKGVLMIHAAGNDSKNIDTVFNFPSRAYLDGKRPVNWITVGASGDSKIGGLVADFSNYGKKEVDVFAPGVQIYSTVPGGNTYQNLQGTSMASPVVAGLAAFIMSYYPSLTATQVKDIIEKSVVKPTEKVETPGTHKEVMLSEISKTGGIVNAYEAIKLAATMAAGKKK